MRAAGLILAAGLAALSPALHAAGEDPRQLIAELEARLLAARRVVVEASIRSSGVVSSDLRGRAELSGNNRIGLAFSGGFAGRTHDLEMKSNGRVLVLRRGADAARDDVGSESNRAVLIGLVRMGLLHNLARLTSLQGPDHARGGVGEWVQLDTFRQTTYAMGGTLEGAVSVGFDVVVAGQPSATARLWLDAQTGLPVRREQTVRFQQGEMTVVEDYARFILE